MKTVIKDLQTVLDLDGRGRDGELEKYHQDEARPGELWDPSGNGGVAGGQNFAPEDEGDG